MQAHPAARDEEFRTAIAWCTFRPAARVLDVPSGAGYLTRHLDRRDMSLLCVDPSAAFSTLGRQIVPGSSVQAEARHLPLADASTDVIISLAGLHHENDRHPLFMEWRRVIRPDGQLLIAEVETGSAVAAFLDGFVDRYNPMGHRGAFVDTGFRQELTAAGWRIERDALTESCWRFGSLVAMTDFFRHLFDLRRASDSRILNGIRTHLGWHQDRNGIAVPWPLRQLLATPGDPYGSSDMKSSNLPLAARGISAW